MQSSCRNLIEQQKSCTPKPVQEMQFWFAGAMGTGMPHASVRLSRTAATWSAGIPRIRPGSRKVSQQTLGSPLVPFALFFLGCGIPYKIRQPQKNGALIIIWLLGYQGQHHSPHEPAPRDLQLRRGRRLREAALRAEGPRGGRDATGGGLPLDSGRNSIPP